jgi:hypothetical protein
MSTNGCFVPFAIMPWPLVKQVYNCGAKIVSGLLRKCATGLNTADMWGANFS